VAKVEIITGKEVFLERFLKALVLFELEWVVYKRSRFIICKSYAFFGIVCSFFLRRLKLLRSIRFKDISGAESSQYYYSVLCTDSFFVGMTNSVDVCFLYQ
jgi:hypothetical protein